MVSCNPGIWIVESSLPAACQSGLKRYSDSQDAPNGLGGLPYMVVPAAV